VKLFVLKDEKVRPKVKFKNNVMNVINMK